MANYLTEQNYSSYTQDDHNTWAVLCEKQSKLGNDRISKQYVNSFHQLDIDKSKIAKISDVSKLLESLSEWTLFSVNGLLPAKDFFQMISNRCYPVTVSIRKPHEWDFSEQPDIFHDICGHLPLLTNKEFAKFLATYSRIALKYVNHQRALDFLARLYWFTYEMGIIIENDEYKPYGAALVTSINEIGNAEKHSIPKHSYDIEHIFYTEFTPYSIQKEYFAINSFDDLFSSLDVLESKINKHMLLKNSEAVK